LTDRQNLYDGASLAAWAYIFLHLDFKLGTVSVLPDFVGYMMFLSVIRLLSEERRDTELLRPLCILLAVWNFVDWLASWRGGTISGTVTFLDVIINVAMLYFHFQLLTDCAAIATTFQPEGENLDRRFLKWRTVNVLLLTLISVAIYLPEWEWLGFAELAFAVVILIVTLCLVSCLFELRDLFSSSEDDTPPMEQE